MFDTPDVYSWLTWALAGLGFVLGLQILGVSGLFTALVLVLLVVTGAAYLAGSRARNVLTRPDPRFKSTGEVFLDHASGKVMRVHVDKATGERRYWKDNG
jgi:hypothetical protein